MDYRAKKEKEKKTTGFDRGVVSTATGTVGQGVGSSFDTFIVSFVLCIIITEQYLDRMSENKQDRQEITEIQSGSYATERITGCDFQMLQAV